MWRDTADVATQWQEACRFRPRICGAERERLIAEWHRAVERTKRWEAQA
jgi:glycerol kinase